MYYAGCDVSLKETFISIVDKDGKIVTEQIVASDVQALSSYLKQTKLPFEKVGIESGQLSIHLCKGLSQQNLPATCVDARHMAAALSARINKNDKNDARGIAQMLRVGLYKEVSVKSDEAREVKFLLGSRSHLINTERELKGTIRGLLKMYGVKIRSEARFFEDIEAVKKRLPDPVQKSIEAILSSLREIGRSRAEIDAELTEIGKKDEDCKRLMTIPGVGVLTALMYQATIDHPERFVDSYNVGAYLGLTPKQYASGEINRYGHVSKMGSKECRTALYEAAQCLLTRSKANSLLKAWGLRLMKRIGRKKAIVAVARKLGIIMHRMLIEKTVFRYNHKEKEKN